MLSKCELCPRCCGVNRLAGDLGYCKAGGTAQVYRYAPHHGEEPPISGTRGSGTVFFSHCTMKCLYCQNYPWSQQGKGDHHNIEELAEIFESLRNAGCHNWNLVSPTSWLPLIREALGKVKGTGVSLPVVYNTSGYERAQTLREFRGLADVYLTDLRYAREETARDASSAPGYVAVARAALVEMQKMAGPLKLSDEGVATSGVICRLLILPGHAEEAVENLEWLAKTVGTGIAVSVMAQYTPAHKALTRSPWARRIALSEYRSVREAMERLGFTSGWIQDFEENPSTEWAGFAMKSTRHAKRKPAPSEGRREFRKSFGASRKR